MFFRRSRRLVLASNSAKLTIEDKEVEGDENNSVEQLGRWNGGGVNCHCDGREDGLDVRATRYSNLPE